MKCCRTSPRLTVALLLLFTLPISWAMPDATWPGSCGTTLQQCIDAASDGDWIEIATDGPINESLLVVDQSLRLTAAEGFAAAFAAGREIDARSSLASFSFQMENLALVDARARIGYSGSGTAMVNVVNNRFTGDRTGIEVSNFQTGSLDVRIEGNRLLGKDTLFNGALIELEANDGTMDAIVVHNHVQAEIVPGVDFTDGWGILSSARSGATVNASIGFNDVRGRFGRDAIGLSEGLFSSTPSTLNGKVHSNVMVCSGQRGKGFGSVILEGSIDVELVNNTITDCSFGTGFSRWSGSSGGGGITGNMLNNLVAYNDRGIFLNPEFQSTVNNSFNLIFGNGSNQFTPGTNTVTTDPLLVSIKHPFLREGSSAIDAGNAFAPLLQVAAGLSNLDAAGMRRSTAGGVDIGAYEHGNISIRHAVTDGNRSGNSSSLSEHAINQSATSRLFITPSYERPPVFDHPFGVFRAGAEWAVFSQDFSTLSTADRFNVWNPVTGSGVFSHLADAGNISGWSTQIDDSSLNNNPDKFVLATQNWTLGGAGIYNPHPIGVFYFGFGGPGSWLITNIDQLAGEDMPENIGFNVYTQDLSPNAFRVTVTSANRAGQAVVLDHPLLNDTPCAQLQATRVFTGTPISEHFDVRYQQSSGRWQIFHQDVFSIPLGSQYFVLVDPQQVHLCNGSLFGDSFE